MLGTRNPSIECKEKKTLLVERSFLERRKKEKRFRKAEDGEEGEKGVNSGGEGKHNRIADLPISISKKPGTILQGTEEAWPGCINDC